jgi:serine/threonine protein phosphatase PrpC
MITAEEIQNVLSKNRDDLDATCKTLIDLANEKGGADNITLVLLHCLTE